MQWAVLHVISHIIPHIWINVQLISITFLCSNLTHFDTISHILVHSSYTVCFLLAYHCISYNTQRVLLHYIKCSAYYSRWVREVHTCTICCSLHRSPVGSIHKADTLHISHLQVSMNFKRILPVLNNPPPPSTFWWHAIYLRNLCWTFRHGGNKYFNF